MVIPHQDLQSQEVFSISCWTSFVSLGEVHCSKLCSVERCQDAAGVNVVWQKMQDADPFLYTDTPGLPAEDSSVANDSCGERPSADAAIPRVQIRLAETADDLWNASGLCTRSFFPGAGRLMAPLLRLNKVVCMQAGRLD